MDFRTFLGAFVNVPCQILTRTKPRFWSGEHRKIGLETGSGSPLTKIATYGWRRCRALRTRSHSSTPQPGKPTGAFRQTGSGSPIPPMKQANGKCTSARLMAHRPVRRGGFRYPTPEEASPCGGRTVGSCSTCPVTTLCMPWIRPTSEPRGRCRCPLVYSRRALKEDRSNLQLRELPMHAVRHPRRGAVPDQLPCGTGGTVYRPAELGASGVTRWVAKRRGIWLLRQEWAVMVVRPVGQDEDSPEIVLVQNWFDELQRLVPTP